MRSVTAIPGAATPATGRRRRSCKRTAVNRQPPGAMVVMAEFSCLNRCGRQSGRPGSPATALVSGAFAGWRRVAAHPARPAPASADRSESAIAARCAGTVANSAAASAASAAGWVRLWPELGRQATVWGDRRSGAGRPDRPAPAARTAAQGLSSGQRLPPLRPRRRPAHGRPSPAGVHGSGPGAPSVHRRPRSARQERLTQPAPAGCADRGTPPRHRDRSRIGTGNGAAIRHDNTAVLPVCCRYRTSGRSRMGG